LSAYFEFFYLFWKSADTKEINCYNINKKTISISHSCNSFPWAPELMTFHSWNRE
jgi:hypothetical protein